MLVLCVGVSLTAWGTLRAWRNMAPTVPDLLPAITGVAVLLFAPGTATYHFVLLWLPLAIVMMQPVDGRWIRWWVLAAYVVIGWLPYSWFRTFEHASGIVVIFAYPRLIILSLMFCGMLLMAVRGPTLSDRWKPRVDPGPVDAPEE